MFKTLFTVSMFFCLNAQSNELFGYKLYEDILKYENDGSIKLKKGNIESISINEGNVLIAADDAKTISFTTSPTDDSADNLTATVEIE